MKSTAELFTAKNIPGGWLDFSGFIVEDINSLKNKDLTQKSTLNSG